MIDVEPRTVRSYRSVIGKHVRPLLGALKVSRVGAEVLDSFYAELRRCRDHCDGMPYVEVDHV